MKWPAELTYATLKLGPVSRRFLFCRTDEKPFFGDASFDYMNFFGFGSGELNGSVPLEYNDVRVRSFVLTDPAQPDMDKVFLHRALLTPDYSGLVNQESEQIVGFYTHDGEVLHALVRDDEGVQLTHFKPFHWHYYTQLGDRHMAVAHLQAMNRRHFVFQTYDEQSDLLNRFTAVAGI